MKKGNKLSTDLHRLLSTQNFKTEKELKDFLASLAGQTIPSFEKEALTPQEQAEDLVFEAWENDHPMEGMAKVVEALTLDPDCITAYEYLATVQPSPHACIPMYAYGVKIGREKFGGKFLKENKGHFWLIHETRPFMRCLHQYASCLYMIGKNEEGLKYFNELLELNPNDNQGARFEYMLYLLECGQHEKFLKLEKDFEYEQNAAASFNRALHAFLTAGDTAESRALLKKAASKNKYIVGLLVKKHPDFDELPGAYSHGSKDEAIVYASYAWVVWQDMPGAVNWVKQNKK